jgi:thiosulfate/3-mercaptopyruvate sulfurtransferase
VAASSANPLTSSSPERSALRLAFAAAWLIVAGAAVGAGSYPTEASTWTVADTLSPFPVRELAEGVYAVPGDSGRGSEGRSNAGFVVTEEDVIVIDALGSPLQGERLVRAIREVTPLPIRWLVLTHHHPDHHFGAVVLERGGARVIAHPDRSTVAAEQGGAALVEAWTAVVGREEMRGFEFADAPDVPVTADSTLELGGKTLVVAHPGPAHTPGDLFVWLPSERVLFAGDLLVEDGVTMVVDGDSKVLIGALDRLAALDPRVVVPGHGRIADEPRALIDLTRGYIEGLRVAMQAAIEEGRSLNQVLAGLPPAEENRPVSRPARERRNAVRVYLEMEREAMGFQSSSAPVGRRAGRGAGPAATLPAGAGGKIPELITTDELAGLIERGGVTIVDVRTDIGAYLKSHLPDAVYLNSETLRAGYGGVPNLLLPAASYRTLFSRLGVRMDLPVAIYSAGESRNIDATYLAWILAGFGHPAVRVLDGGFGKWELEGRPVTRKYPHFAPLKLAAREFTPERATLEEVRLALGRKDVVLVDARPPDQYAGEAGAQLRRGHIPGAINHYWQEDLVQGEFARVWKPSEEIRARYAAQGITSDKQIIAYCNGGLESSHVHFTLRGLLGYPRVKVYDGSYTEWSEREDLPIETGPGAAPPGNL